MIGQPQLLLEFLFPGLIAFDSEIPCCLEPTSEATGEPSVFLVLCFFVQEHLRDRIADALDVEFPLFRLPRVPRPHEETEMPHVLLLCQVHPRSHLSLGVNHLGNSPRMQPLPEHGSNEAARISSEPFLQDGVGDPFSFAVLPRIPHEGVPIQEAYLLQSLAHPLRTIEHCSTHCLPAASRLTRSPFVYKSTAPGLQTLAQQSDVLPSDPLFHHELDLENVPLSTRKLELSLRPPLFFTPMSIIFEKFFEKFAFLKDCMKAGNLGLPTTDAVFQQTHVVAISPAHQRLAHGSLRGSQSHQFHYVLPG
mmetsp:Transcript_24341/g.63978  ORF Transcript_24341/g.63978 Transcript_24341/m.63978 type:complete len:307 (+) Transcript_24341:611-1531(+)